MARTQANPKKQQPEQLQLDLRAAGGLTAAEVARLQLDAKLARDKRRHELRRQAKGLPA